MATSSAMAPQAPLVPRVTVPLAALGPKKLPSLAPVVPLSWAQNSFVGQLAEDMEVDVALASPTSTISLLPVVSELVRVAVAVVVQLAVHLFVLLLWAIGVFVFSPERTSTWTRVARLSLALKLTVTAGLLVVPVPCAR